MIEAVHRRNWRNNIEHRVKVLGEPGAIAAGGNCPLSDVRVGGRVSTVV
jgi:hypothetical protein